MGEVISIGKVGETVRKLKSQGKKNVLVGGCFDVLHPGHVIFLEEAKKEGDILLVLLESDDKVKRLKGKGRPIHNQEMRAKVLSALRMVDYVVMLPNMTDVEYDHLVNEIKPDVIAATSGNGMALHHQRSAKLSGADFKFVTKQISDYSTSKILES